MQAVVGKALFAAAIFAYTNLSATHERQSDESLFWHRIIWEKNLSGPITN